MNFIPSPVAPAVNMLSVINIREETVMTFKTEVQVFTLSDLHVDMKGNMEWVEQHCIPPSDTPCNVFTVFICAGDVSADLNCVRRAFRHLSDNYDAVCFVPGNHDVWKRNDIKGDDSLAKLRDLISLASLCDVYVGPLHVHCIERNASILDVYPLYSWYHSSWDQEPDLTTPAAEEKEKEFPFHLKWSDFRRCLWPGMAVKKYDFLSVSSSIEDHKLPLLCSMFADLNTPFINQSKATREKRINEAPAIGGVEANANTNAKRDSEPPVITFSHFLPRQECCIEKRFLTEQHLMKVVGSNTLDSQIRALHSDLHIFGHTHIPIDVTVEGQRYLQWPLGYAREADLACAVVRCVSAPLLVYDSRLESAIPTDMPSFDAFWSGYYRKQERQPSTHEATFPDLVRALVDRSDTATQCPCCVVSNSA